VDPGDAVAAAAALNRDEHNIAWLVDPLLATGARRDPAGIAERLSRWRSTGVVRHDDWPSWYVYRQRHGERHLRGLVAAIPLRDAPQRLVGHEQVNRVTVGRHLALLQATAAQPEPIVLVHPGSDPLRRLLDQATEAESVVSFADGTAEHTLWRLDDRDATADAADLPVEHLLIADGHHRLAAFERYRDSRGNAPGPWTHGLAMLVDAREPGLVLGAIHRVVPSLGWHRVDATPGTRSHRLPDEAAAWTWLAAAPRGLARAVLSDGDVWVGLETQPAPPDPAEPRPSLAVAHLHDHWLASWGVRAADVDHVSEPARAISRARHSGGLAVLLPAPLLETVLGAARSGHLLPPKATWFGPKPRLGLVMRHWPGDFDDLAVPDPAGLTADAASAAPG